MWQAALSYTAHDDEFWPTGPLPYRRHQPEKTLLYQLVEQHWPPFQTMLEAQGKRLPGYVIREFDEYLKCGRLEHGFLRVRCESCHHEKLVALVCSPNYTSCVLAVMAMLASYK